MKTPFQLEGNMMINLENCQRKMRSIFLLLVATITTQGPLLIGVCIKCQSSYSCSVFSNSANALNALANSGSRLSALR